VVAVDVVKRLSDTLGENAIPRPEHVPPKLVQKNQTVANSLATPAETFVQATAPHALAKNAAQSLTPVLQAQLAAGQLANVLPKNVLKTQTVALKPAEAPEAPASDTFPNVFEASVQTPPKLAKNAP